MYFYNHFADNKPNIVLASNNLVSDNKTPNSNYGKSVPVHNPRSHNDASSYHNRNNNNNVSSHNKSSKILINGKYLALTFDDGPNPKITPIILNILEKNNVRATFFVVGENAQRYPELIKRMYRDGDQIGNHTFNHPFMTRISKKNQIMEITRNIKIIQKILPGYKITAFRPPYGDLNNQVEDEVFQNKENIVFWSVDDEDYRGYSPDVLQKNVYSEVFPGGVVLMHDIHYNTTLALNNEIEHLKKLKYKFLTIDEIIKKYKIMPKARYPLKHPDLIEIVNLQK